MNWKSWVPLVLAIVLGVVAAKVARDAILKNRTVAAPIGKYTKVVVAQGDVQPGRELAAGDLTLAQVQADMVPANSFSDVGKVVGRVTETLMVKGQPIVEPMLAPQGTGSGLQALVPPGLRAISVEVNEFSGVAGLLTPGSRVDIIATINDGTSGSQLARTIVQNVKVTAVGQRTAVNPNEPPPPQHELFKSVTVLVTPADAEAIELACAMGRPRLVLRGGRDQDVTETAGITLGELRGSSGRGEPFTAPAVNMDPAPTTRPLAATQPAGDVTESVAQRSGQRRVIKVIRGGVESSVTMNVLEGLPPEAYGTTDASDPFDAN